MLASSLSGFAMLASSRWTTNRVRRFVRLRPSEQMAVLLAVLAAPIVRHLLDSRGYQAAADMLRRRRRRPVAGLVEATTISRLAESAMLWMPGRYSCLSRSLVVWWLVGGDEVSRIQLGVAPPSAGVVPRFHAWVEVEDVPINDLPDVGERYLPLTSPAPPPERFD